MQSTMKPCMLLLILSLVCSINANAADDDVILDQIVAVVNDGIILDSELKAEARFLEQQARSAQQSMPDDEVMRSRILERLINQEIQRQRAAELGIDIDPAAVNNAVDRIAGTNNMNTFEFRKTLQAQGFDYNQFRGNIRHELLLNRLIQRDVEQAINVSEQEIDDFITSSSNASREDRVYQLQHILVAVPSSSPSAKIETARTKANTLAAKLQAGADFASTAAAESDGRHALKGGDLGWRKLQDLPSFLHQLVKETEEGSVSNPVQSADGFHIVRVVSIRTDVPAAATETRARHIFIETAKDADDKAAKETLNEVRRRIMGGEKFAAMAEEFSDDPNSSGKGGELPWFSTGDMPEELEQKAAASKPGVVSEPFRTTYGWHLLEVLERRTASTTDETLRREAELNLRQRKLEQETERWSRRMRSEAYVEVKG